MGSYSPWQSQAPPLPTQWTRDSSGHFYKTDSTKACFFYELGGGGGWLTTTALIPFQASPAKITEAGVAGILPPDDTPFWGYSLPGALAPLP